MGRWSRASSARAKRRRTASRSIATLGPDVTRADARLVDVFGPRGFAERRINRIRDITRDHEIRAREGDCAIRQRDAVGNARDPEVAYGFYAVAKYERRQRYDDAVDTSRAQE